MNAKQKDATVKAAMTGLMLASAAVTTLGTTGCDQLSEMQPAAMPSGEMDEIASLAMTIKYSELSSRIAYNHNETFLST